MSIVDSKKSIQLNTTNAICPIVVLPHVRQKIK